MNETDTSRFDRGQMLVLEQMAKGAPLADVLRDLVLLIEEQAEGMVCSILLTRSASDRALHTDRNASPASGGPTTPSSVAPWQLTHSFW